MPAGHAWPSSRAKWPKSCPAQSQLALNVLADAKGVVWLYGELVMLLEYLSRVRLVYGDNLLVILEFV